MKVNEIFTSLQGEGKNSGKLTTFIRFHGCNLNCSYCDTKLDSNDYVHTNIYEIVEKVKHLECKRICITGGEPLIQKNLIPLLTELKRWDFDISVETNGTILIPYEIQQCVDITMDIKCPSSGITDLGYTDINLTKLGIDDEIKFVIGTLEDYRFMLNYLEKIENVCKCKNVYVSPVFRDDKYIDNPMHWVPKKIIKNKLNVVFMLQIHKLVEVK